MNCSPLAMKKKASDDDDAPPPPPQNSTCIISSLMRAELNMDIKQQAWDKIEQMLESDSHVTRAVDPATGELPLHVLARKCKSVRTLAIDLAIVGHPQGLLHQDSNGQIALHAAAKSGSSGGLKIIYEAYKEGRKCFDNAGRLPIHVAAEAKSVVALRYLLDQDPTLAMSTIQKTKTVSEDHFLGGLPIHCACRHGASGEIVDVLLSKSASSAKMKDFRGNLPIHLLLKHGGLVESGSVKALVSAYSLSLKKKDPTGDIPLIIALKQGVKSNIIEYLFYCQPETAGEQSGDGRSPLTIAIENCIDETTILKILEQSPAFATTVDDKTGLLPIEIATNQHRSPQLIHFLLLKDLPIDLSDRRSDASASYCSSYQLSWEHVVSNDRYSEVVSNILQSCTHAQKIALANISCRSSEKPLLDVAAPKCKRALLVGMRLFGIIELTDIAPAFATDRTSIYYGLKYPEAPAEGVNVIFEGKGGAKSTELSGTATAVIVKLTPYRKLMEKELSLRRDYQLSSDCVPRIYSVHYSEEPLFDSESLDSQPLPAYCISMEQGLTLENILLEKIKEKDASAIVPMEDIRQIAKNLLHLHDKGLVHCDFGSHNVGKFDGGKYKLLSIGGAVPVGHATDPDRGWYFPPEVVVTAKKNKLKLKPKPKLVSIAAAHTLDLWAFGAMMYQLLCGIPLSLYASSPDRNANVAGVKSWNEKALSKALGRLPMKDEAAADLLLGLLQPKPSRRIASMKEVIAHRFFSNEEQNDKKDEVDMSLPPPSPEETSELREVDPSVIMAEKLSDTVYLIQGPRLQADDSVDSRKSDDTAKADNEKTRHGMEWSTLHQEDATSFFSYPTQDLRQKGTNLSYPIQERRSTFPVQERRGNAATASSHSTSTPNDATGDHQSVSSSLLDLNSAYRSDGDCFSTASTKFADNTSATIEALKREVPMQVETKPQRRSSCNGGENDELSERPATTETGANISLQIESPCAPIDSDDESEPGRIVPGSRLRKRAQTQYHDPQLI